MPNQAQKKKTEKVVHPKQTVIYNRNDINKGKFQTPASIDVMPSVQIDSYIQ